MPDPPTADETAMHEAIALSRQGKQAGELPYGAVVVDSDGRVIGRGRDRVASDADLTSHAEILAVRDAAQRRARSLDGLTLVSTVEPCAMCFSAAWTAGVSRLVYGLSMEELRINHPASMDEISITAIELNSRTQRRLDIVFGVLREQCLSLWP